MSEENPMDSLHRLLEHIEYRGDVRVELLPLFGPAPISLCRTEPSSRDRRLVLREEREERILHAFRERLAVLKSGECVIEYIAPFFAREDRCIMVIITADAGEYDCSRLESFYMLISDMLSLTLKEHDYTGSVSSCIKRYLDVNLECTVQVKSIAELFGYNEKYLGRAFTRSMGIGIREYINLSRLVKVEHMLRETDMTVFEISSAAGYSDACYLNRVFKAKYGMSPLEYRLEKSRSRDGQKSVCAAAYGIDDRRV